MAWQLSSGDHGRTFNFGFTVGGVGCELFQHFAQVLGLCHQTNRASLKFLVAFFSLFVLSLPGACALLGPAQDPDIGLSMQQCGFWHRVYDAREAKTSWWICVVPYMVNCPVYASRSLSLSLSFSFSFSDTHTHICVYYIYIFMIYDIMWYIDILLYIVFTIIVVLYCIVLYCIIPCHFISSVGVRIFSLNGSDPLDTRRKKRHERHPTPHIFHLGVVS